MVGIVCFRENLLNLHVGKGISFMLETVECIALRTVRYNDKKHILGVYTPTHGRLSLAVQAGAGKGAMRIRALTMPLSRFSCVIDFRPGREIYSFRDVKPVDTGMLDPVKGSIAMFVAEALSVLLREPQPDPHLFDFVSDSVAALGAMSDRGVANYHIVFLMRLQHFLGIEPDWSTYRRGALLDLTDGVYRPFPPDHRNFLPSTEAEFARKLSRISFRNAPLFRLSRADRNLILDRLIHYYSIHSISLANLNSLAVLRSLFDF